MMDSLPKSWAQSKDYYHSHAVAPFRQHWEFDHGCPSSSLVDTTATFVFQTPVPKSNCSLVLLLQDVHFHELFHTSKPYQVCKTNRLENFKLKTRNSPNYLNNHVTSEERKTLVQISRTHLSTNKPHAPTQLLRKNDNHSRYALARPPRIPKSPRQHPQTQPDSTPDDPICTPRFPLPILQDPRTNRWRTVSSRA